MSVPIASRCRAIDASGIRKVFELAEKKRRSGTGEFIDLSIGQPDFAVPDAIKEAAIQAIQDDYNTYTMTQGIPSLREKLAGQFQQRFGVEADGLMITSGVSGRNVQCAGTYSSSRSSSSVMPSRS